MLEKHCQVMLLSEPAAAARGTKVCPFCPRFTPTCRLENMRLTWNVPWLFPLLLSRMIAYCHRPRGSRVHTPTGGQRPGACLPGLGLLRHHRPSRQGRLEGVIRPAFSSPILSLFCNSFCSISSSLWCMECVQDPVAVERRCKAIFLARKLSVRPATTL